MVLELLAGIASADPRTREVAADEVTDVHRRLPSQDVDALTAALVDARLAETVRGAQEAQLHALAELAEWHELPEAQVQRLTAVPRPTGDKSQDEYLSYLLAGDA